MKVHLLVVIAAWLLMSSSAVLSQSLSAKREVLRADVAITTLSAAELARIAPSDVIEHDSEVARTESVTVVVSVQGCERDDQGVCHATADAITYKPDGSVHSEAVNVRLTNGRGTTALMLAPSDVVGVYKVIATVRDLSASRFARAERQFGVKER